MGEPGRAGRGQAQLAWLLLGIKVRAGQAEGGLGVAPPEAPGWHTTAAGLWGREGGQSQLPPPTCHRPATPLTHCHPPHSPLVMWETLASLLRTPSMRDWVCSISWPKASSILWRPPQRGVPGAQVGEHTPPASPESQPYMPCSSSSSPTRPDMCFRTRMLPDTMSSWWSCWSRISCQVEGMQGWQGQPLPEGPLPPPSTHLLCGLLLLEVARRGRDHAGIQQVAGGLLGS